MWKFHDFSVTQILREIKFGEIRSYENAVSSILMTEFCYFIRFQPSKSAEIHKNQNSEPLNVLKWQILHFLIPQI